MPPAETRTIGDVAIAVHDRGSAIALLEGWVSAGERRTVSFANAHSVNLAARDPAFRAALSQMLVLNDGIGVDLGSRLLYGARFPANLNGTDFVPALLAAAQPRKVALLGAAPGVADQAATRLAAAFPQHRFTVIGDGFFADEAAIVDRLAAAQADYVLLGMGQPRQELFAARHAGRWPGVTLCIGAYIDFAAGRVPRAPLWVRKLHGEWLFRLSIEPRRMAGRYLIGNARFLAAMLIQRVKKKGPVANHRAL
ncbi:WecB/TagA/CpsF family glycosyltransferase [Sphingomonas crocodyli]|uniref:Glycosyltransferase n=1 Tax=Sphingomonas crocodyli TaxID=1979270 RepID=A0A437M6R7_9SPHN|nr:WecB/TagA/CpsF family glycosyltransferase [Sphingomonas crocodyli]RVT93410.1 glycosyltransferase [Sphingomonas crocodyli]